MNPSLGSLAEVTGTTAPPLGGHLLHVAGALGFLVLTLGGVALSEHVQGTPRGPRARRRPSKAVIVIAVASVGAAAVHAAVVPEHFEEAASYGVFFTIAAVVQLVYSVLLLVRPSRLLVATGIAGNVALISLWLLTRTIGIPLGPDAGSAESFGVLDILASSCEAMVVLAGIAALARGRLARIRSAQIRPARTYATELVSIR